MTPTSQKTRFLGLAVTVALGVLVGVSSLATEACTITTSDKPLDFGDGGTITNPPPPAVALACNECLFQGCTNLWAVCQNNLECRAIYQCSTKPGLTQADVTACFCTHPTGQNAYVALSACNQVEQCGSCASNCSATPASSCANPGVFQENICAGFDAGTPPEEVDSGTTPVVDAAVPPPMTTDAATVGDCKTCNSSKCATEDAACGPDSDCVKFSLCTLACQDLACFDKCATDHAAGKAASSALDTCTRTNCAALCGL